MGGVDKGRIRLELICDACNKSYTAMRCTDNKHMEKYGKHLCRSCAKKGDRNPFYGYKFTDEKKAEFSNIRKEYYNDTELGPIRRESQRTRFIGEGNPMYKGAENKSDYTHRNKYPRKLTLERDKYTCVVCCNVHSIKELIAHHLNSCDKHKDGRLDVSNMVTVCKCCHKLFHHIYGYGNNTKEQFDEFISKGSETIETGVSHGVE